MTAGLRNDMNRLNKNMSADCNVIPLQDSYDGVQSSVVHSSLADVSQSMTCRITPWIAVV